MVGTRVDNFVSELRKQPASGRSLDTPGPTISVVMPSLNQGAFIRKSILSVLNQDYPKVELIIVDGGSTDETVRVVKEFESYIRFWIRERDSGQSDALNKGFAHATGDIYAWQNADDLYLPGSFSAAVTAFKSHPGATVVYGDWITIDEIGDMIDKTYALPVRTPQFPYENMKCYNQAMFWRREAHDRIGDFDVNLNRLMDNDMVIRLIRSEGRERFIQVPQFLGAFRYHAHQKTSLSRVDSKRLEEEQYLTRKYNFHPERSLVGQYHRLVFRAYQLLHALRRGGARYAISKSRKGIAQRGGLY